MIDVKDKKLTRNEFVLVKSEIRTNVIKCIVILVLFSGIMGVVVKVLK